jgi:hypothetical protein
MKFTDKIIQCLPALVVICALMSSHAGAQVLNPGFETAGTNASAAANWVVTQASGGPVYAVRTNDNPHSGAFNFEIHLASTGGGPLVEFAQTGVPVTAGFAYTFSFFANRLAGSAADNDEYNVQWVNTNSVPVGQTGYTGYAPGANIWSQTVVNGLMAPAGAVTANLYFHTAGAAATNLSATIQFDDVSFSTTNSSGGGITNQFQPATIVPGVGITWFATNGVPYQVQWATNQATNAIWNNLGGLIIGNGVTNTVFDPAGPPHNAYQVISVQ